MGAGKVLIVDDDRNLATQVRDLLRFEGYETTIAHNGQEGLSKLKHAVPDLILLDMSMPELGGIGFLKRFGSMTFTTPPAVLVFTARTNMGDFFDGVNVAGFLTKPCDADTLLKTVNDVMARRRASAALKVDAPLPSGTRVLLAEDDSEAALRIAEALGATDFLVERVGTGPEAIERAVEQRPHAVVAKVILTGLNGPALASTLNEMPTTRDIPIVLYDDSGREEPEDKYVTGRDSVKAFVRGNNAYKIVSVVKQVLA